MDWYCSALFSILLIIIPPVFKLAIYFDASNYYQLISGIIGGVITLYVLLMQFAHENERRREEERINARGIFEVNYIKKLEERLAKCKAEIYKSNRTGESYSSFYIIIKLHSDKCIFDCHVIFDGFKEEERFNRHDIALIGLVVPKQTVAIPLCFNYVKTDITIIYRTFMGETIKHQFKFENGINKPASSEVMYCKKSNDLINIDNLSNIHFSKKFDVIFESQSRLFEYSNVSE